MLKKNLLSFGVPQTMLAPPVISQASSLILECAVTHSLYAAAMQTSAPQERARMQSRKARHQESRLPSLIPLPINQMVEKNLPSFDAPQTMHAPPVKSQVSALILECAVTHSLHAAAMRTRAPQESARMHS